MTRIHQLTVEVFVPCMEQPTICCTPFKGEPAPRAPGPQAGPTPLASNVPACRFDEVLVKIARLFRVIFFGMFAISEVKHLKNLVK